MLKNILILIVAVTFLGSLFWMFARTPHVRAFSASVKIVHMQAGGVGAALQERIVLFNPTEIEQDLTGWCLVNKNDEKIACLNESNTQYILPPGSYTNIVSRAYADKFIDQQFAVVYEPLNRTSGSITGSAASVSLVDASKQLVDAVSWSQSIPGGSAIERKLADSDTLLYQDTDAWADWRMYTPVDTPVFEESLLMMDTSVPCTDADCTETINYPTITELLPNAQASDEGAEYIEFYNPSDVSVMFDTLVLVVASSTTERRFPLAALSPLEPGQYYALYNSLIPFSMNNTSGTVWIEDAHGMLSEAVTYSQPKEGRSWALMNGVWEYTNQPTPGAENVPMVELAPIVASANELKPCAETQYRHPETNRCRNLTSTESTRVPCRENQYRSEETNRCRNIVTAGAALAPCKEGQERNPDTNRCRNSNKVQEADYAVLAAQSTPGGASWYLWAIIGGLGVLALGYAAWEWRTEVVAALARLGRLVRIVK